MREKEFTMRPSFALIVLVVLLTVALPAAVSGRTWLIEDDGSGDAPTIQAGIDSAAAADTVLLAEGTFTGPGNRDIDFAGKAITVRSDAASVYDCMVDCQGSSGDPHAAFIFDNNETASSVLENITITGGYRSSAGAVAVYYSSPTITGCVFAGNTAATAGGALDMINSVATLTNCHFISNLSLSAGGAVFMEGSSPTMTDCNFSWNNAVHNGGALDCHGNSPSMTGCIFQRNSGERGGAVHMDNGCTASFAYCRFSDNRSAAVGAAVRCSGSSPTFENCSFAADSAGSGGVIHLGNADAPGFTNTVVAFSKAGSAVECDGVGTGVGLACCDIYGNAGGDWVGCIAVHAGINGNMSSDPRFCNIPTGDLRVEECSPCMPDHNDCGVFIGAQGQGCGCGESTEPTTWGAIKATYR
jgi:hypothetical protein